MAVNHNMPRHVMMEVQTRKEQSHLANFFSDLIRTDMEGCSGTKELWTKGWCDPGIM